MPQPYGQTPQQPYGQNQPPIQQIPPANQGYPGYAGGAYQQAPAYEGAVSAAWRDITGTPGWPKKLLLLCVLGCIPILNLGVEGYALRWNRELMFGDRMSMPREVFKKKEIITGFRALLIEFVFYSALAIVSTLLGLLAGAIASPFGYTAIMGMSTFIELVVGLFAFILFSPFVNAAIVRMVTVDYLEGGLNVKKIRTAFRRNMGGAIGASIIPELAVGAVQAILVGIILAIVFALGYQLHPSNILYGYYGYSGSGAVAAFALVFIVLLVFVIAMLSVFAMLLRWRAVGHWAARIAPEWKTETDEEEFASRAAAEWQNGAQR